MTAGIPPPTQAVIAAAICALLVAGWIVLLARASRRRPQPARRERVYYPSSHYGRVPGSQVCLMCRCCGKRPAETRDGECGICLSYWECRPD